MLGFELYVNLHGMLPECWPVFSIYHERALVITGFTPRIGGLEAKNHQPALPSVLIGSYKQMDGQKKHG